MNEMRRMGAQYEARSIIPFHGDPFLSFCFESIKVINIKAWCCAILTSSLCVLGEVNSPLPQTHPSPSFSLSHTHRSLSFFLSLTESIQREGRKPYFASNHYPRVKLTLTYLRRRFISVIMTGGISNSPSHTPVEEFLNNLSDPCQRLYK